MATKTTFKFTRPTLEALKRLEKGLRLIVRDTDTRGLELRVTSNGAKTFSVNHRIRGGKVERVPIGQFPAVSVEVARDKAKVVIGQHALGISHTKTVLQKKRDSKSFAEALKEFIDDDTARKSKKPMKPRTRLDYVTMLRGPGKSPSGHTHGAGELHAIAARRIDSLTGAGLKDQYRKLSAKSVTRAGYAMRVTRAVLNYHGVRVEDDPFALTTPQRDRISIPAAERRTRIIPAERLTDWWKAASAVQSGDAFQLLLLTGMRRGELASVRRSDVDLGGARIHLRDTKNRKPHIVALSKQALELVRARAANKEPDDLLYAGASDPRKSLQAIIKATNIPFSAHDCRRTFGTIAASRLPGYVVKRLLNHSDGNDVTGAHYVHLDEATMRTAWQVVADAIVGEAKQPTPHVEPLDNVVSLQGRRKRKA